MSKAVVITVSDSCARGQRQDISGPAVAEALGHAGFDVVAHGIVPDEQAEIEAALREAAARASLIVTTGGTGITRRDVTPEATRAVCGRLMDGLAEQMRSEGRRETPFAVLSRGVCGLLNSSLVVNLPGSPRGAVTSLEAILPVLPHALRLLADPGAEHPVVATVSQAEPAILGAGAQLSSAENAAIGEEAVGADSPGAKSPSIGSAGAHPMNVPSRPVGSV